MKDTNFKIAVGDILTHSSSKDEVVFKEKFSSSFPQIVAPGIETTIILQGMDRSTLLLTFLYIKANLQYTCDKCGQEYIDSLLISTKEVKCLFDGENSDEEDEDMLYYAPSDKVIDVENYIVQSLQLEDMYIHVCTTCQKKQEKEIEDNDM